MSRKVALINGGSSGVPEDYKEGEKIPALEGKDMLYREVPKTGDKLSILGFGCMRLPGSLFNVDEERAIKL
ncbi:MAG: hypothetical protein PHD13_04580 [Methanocellales archaeon]|nr:hypothetical protein [Methanocellales archaeon]MDD3291256.1 hypothetical protein [Methanocellales archaeon]MDD5235428.1 hypothetical protein [Methanocellales archaeon]MDD5484489.1 hypothetical protein [Methanocellales archaeon]